MRMQSIVAFAVATGMLASGCAVKTAASKALGFKKPQIDLLCTPKVANGAALSPVLITATVRVTNPGEKFWCPAAEWFVDDRRTRTHESDCDPYETVAAKEGRGPELWSETGELFVLSGGDHIITVRLSKAGRIIGSAYCTITAY